MQVLPQVPIAKRHAASKALANMSDSDSAAFERSGIVYGSQHRR